MSWTTIIIDPDDKKSKDRLVLSKENCPWHNLRRSVLVYLS